MAQSFYPSKHTGKEIDDAVDLTQQLNTTVNQLSNTKLDKNTTTKNQLYWVNASGNQANLPFQSSVLTSSDDLDNITTYGVYQIYTASVPTNVPLAGVNAILIVFKAVGSQHICQHCSTHTGYMFERYAQYSGGVLTWREWKQIATQIVQTLPEGSDANKLGQTALYATNSSKVTNIPTSISGPFTLLVYQGAASGNVTQVIYTHNTNNTHTGIDKPCSVYVRDTNGFNYANPYWSAWTNLYTEANPSGEVTGGALSKILINDVIYSVGGGGTGPVDTEMSDTSTNAVQNKVIKNYVDSVKNISYTINNSKYWSNSGKMLNAVNYYATDKINVSNYQNQILHIKTALDAVSFIVFFDKYNNKLSTVPYDGTDYKDYVVTVPEDAYFVGITLKDTTGKLSIKITADNLATADVKSADKVYDISSEFEIKNYTIQNDTYYYGANGAIQQNAGYYTVTFRADIFVGLNLEVFTRLDNGIAAIVFLNSEKSKIDAITDTTKTYKKYASTVPAGTKYIGISCFGSAEQYPVRIFVKTISQGLYNVDNILESQQEEYTALTYNSDGGDARIFTHWGAIGDSLSNGVLEYYDDTGVLKADVDRNYSFIQFIGRKLNVFAHNYSKGGTTAKEIYILNQDDMFDSKEQIYTLAFGTNDAGLTEYTGGWGTAADININDYTQNADSFVGYMARIIQRIRVNNPGAIFFLLTKPLAPQAEQLAAIQAVASVLPDVYVIDMTEYSTKVLNKKVNNKPLYTVGAHCSVIGYKLMADFILNSIANVVKADPTHFNTSYKIGVDETKTADYTWATEGYVNTYVDQKVTDAINTSILQVINANY